MTIPELSADCGRCEALCCIALSFDAGPQFAFDKPAGRSCPNLRADNGCAIHAERAVRGMGGCVRYDCLGAGQYVSERLFPGQSWRQAPEILAPMMDAFSLVRQIHELIELLAAAGRWALNERDEAARLALLKKLAPENGWTRGALAAVAIERERAAVNRFVRGLAGRLPAAAAPGCTAGDALGGLAP